MHFWTTGPQFCLAEIDKAPSVTYESNEQEEYLESSSYGRDTVDVSVSHGGHGHHEEVDAVPVAQRLPVVKIGRIARVLQLERSGGKEKSSVQQKKAMPFTAILSPREEVPVTLMT